MNTVVPGFITVTVRKKGEGALKPPLCDACDAINLGVLYIFPQYFYQYFSQ
jgi:hypothetical protein